MNRKATAVAVALALAVGAGSYASPYWTLHQMHAAIEARDADKFSRYVDYPALRESLKGQILSSLHERLGTPALKDTPFASIGKMIGTAMVNTVVDTMVTPAGAMAIMAQGEARPDASPPSQPAPEPPAPAGSSATPPPAPPQRQTLRYDVAYRDWNRVEASARRENGERVVLDLCRDGLWSWKWCGVQLPGGGTRP